MTHEEETPCGCSATESPPAAPDAVSTQALADEPDAVSAQALTTEPDAVTAQALNEEPASPDPPAPACDAPTPADPAAVTPSTAPVPPPAVTPSADVETPAPPAEPPARKDPPAKDAPGGGDGGAPGAEGGCWECGEGEAPPLAYALGQIQIDYGSEARRDWFRQNGERDPDKPDAEFDTDDPVAVLRHLAAHPHDASALIWVLAQEGIPMYAIQPGGAFARYTYGKLVAIYRSQVQVKKEMGKKTLAMVAVPGWVKGEATLMEGATVDILWPEARGIQDWHPFDVVEHFHDLLSARDQPVAQKANDLFFFLGRLYFELRNDGKSPEDRARNYAATEAAEISLFKAVEQTLIEAGLVPATRGGEEPSADAILFSGVENRLLLENLEVSPAPLCREGSDCQDVFFNLISKDEEKTKTHHMTVDVSDVLPVKVGITRSWSGRN